MSHISTLIPDVQELLTKKNWFTEDLAKEFSHAVSQRLSAQFNKEAKAPTLRLSAMGPRCPKALWASIHAPDEAEPLPPGAELKYAYGALIEALAVSLAKAAGHDVRGEQDHVVVDGISGHRDCVIDGCIVDVKSAATRSFQKFKDGSIRDNDGFGYLDQLDGYLVGSLEDPIVTVKDRAYLWAIDKTLGHMCLYEHFIRERSIRERIERAKQCVSQSTAPACECGVVADGESGNLRLDTKASYNSFKYFCRPDLRTFLYSDGPRYLTKVVKRPKNSRGPITEVDRHGRIVYNG